MTDAGERTEYRHEKFPWEREPTRINGKPGFFSFQGRSLRSEYWRVLETVFLVCLVWFLPIAWGGADLKPVEAKSVGAYYEEMFGGAKETASLWSNVGRSLRDIGEDEEAASLCIAGLLACVIMIHGISLPVSVRRCHDLNVPGWLLAVPLVFFAGWIATSVLWSRDDACVQQTVVGWLVMSVPWVLLGCIAGTPGPNQYGPDPKDFRPSPDSADGNGTRVSLPTTDGRCNQPYPSLPCWLALGGCAGMVLMGVLFGVYPWLAEGAGFDWLHENCCWPEIFWMAGFAILGLAALSLRKRDRLEDKRAGNLFWIAGLLLLVGWGCHVPRIAWRAASNPFSGFLDLLDVFQSIRILVLAGGLLAAGVLLLRQRRGGAAIGWAVAMLSMLWNVVFQIAGIAHSKFFEGYFAVLGLRPPGFDLSIFCQEALSDWGETVSTLLLCAGFGLLSANALRRDAGKGNGNPSAGHESAALQPPNDEERRPPHVNH
jgi:uncharacterized membrane protein YhaH (DUF805 family)